MSFNVFSFLKKNEKKAEGNNSDRLSKNMLSDFGSSIEGDQYSRHNEPGNFRPPEPVIVQQTSQSNWAKMAPEIDTSIPAEEDYFQEIIPTSRHDVDTEVEPMKQDAPASDEKKKPEVESSWDVLDWGDE